MNRIPLSKVKPGDFFRRSETTQVTFTKGPYDQTDKRFYCADCDDMNREIALKGTALVWTGFDY